MVHIGGIKADTESAKVVVPVRSPRQPPFGIYGQS